MLQTVKASIGSSQRSPFKFSITLGVTAYYNSHLAGTLCGKSFLFSIPFLYNVSGRGNSGMDSRHSGQYLLAAIL